MVDSDDNSNFLFQLILMGTGLDLGLFFILVEEFPVKYSLFYPKIDDKPHPTHPLLVA